MAVPRESPEKVRPLSGNSFEAFEVQGAHDRLRRYSHRTFYTDLAREKWLKIQQIRRERPGECSSGFFKTVVPVARIPCQVPTERGDTAPWCDCILTRYLEECVRHWPGHRYPTSPSRDNTHLSYRRLQELLCIFRVTDDESSMNFLGEGRITPQIYGSSWIGTGNNLIACFTWSPDRILTLPI